MGTDHPKSPTELRQYLALLKQRDGAGQPFVIVGGHAANFWAEFYSEREPRLKASLPFRSKDLDVIGTENDAKRVADSIGWHLTLPPVGGGPVQAVLSSQPEGVVSPLNSFPKLEACLSNPLSITSAKPWCVLRQRAKP